MSLLAIQNLLSQGYDFSDAFEQVSGVKPGKPLVNNWTGGELKTPNPSPPSSPRSSVNVRKNIFPVQDEEIVKQILGDDVTYTLDTKLYELTAEERRKLMLFRIFCLKYESFTIDKFEREFQECEEKTKTIIKFLELFIEAFQTNNGDKLYEFFKNMINDDDDLTFIKIQYPLSSGPTPKKTLLVAVLAIIILFTNKVNAGADAEQEETSALVLKYPPQEFNSLTSFGVALQNIGSYLLSFFYSKNNYDEYLKEEFTYRIQNSDTRYIGRADRIEEFVFLASFSGEIIAIYTILVNIIKSRIQFFQIPGNTETGDSNELQNNRYHRNILSYVRNCLDPDDKTKDIEDLKRCRKMFVGAKRYLVDKHNDDGKNSNLLLQQDITTLNEFKTYEGATEYLIDDDVYFITMESLLANYENEQLSTNI